MTTKVKTKQRIIDFLKTHKQVTVKELINFLDISRRAVSKHLKSLYEEEKIDKIGKPPTVYYFIKEKEKKKQYKIPSKAEEIISEKFLIITPTGEKKEGVEGFEYWCKKNRLPFEKTAEEYLRTIKKYDRYKKKGLISGNYKLKNTFRETFIDKLFYLEFYSIERFGKTKLGWKLLYAKQSENKELIRELSIEIKSKIEEVIKIYNIDAVGFIPPTLRREIQFMKELERYLSLDLPRLSIEKVRTPIIVAQKSLKKLEDRIENARKTILVKEKRKFKNILLIDDAVGSGATINETARKIQEKGLCKGKIIGIAVTGSFKGFEVISEV